MPAPFYPYRSRRRPRTSVVLFSLYLGLLVGIALLCFAAVSASATTGDEVPVLNAPDVIPEPTLPAPPPPATSAIVDWQCATADGTTPDLAWVQLTNSSDTNDTVSLAGREIPVPAHTTVVVDLEPIQPQGWETPATYALGPISSIVARTDVPVTQGHPYRISGLGDLLRPTCPAVTDVTTAPAVMELAFTGAWTGAELATGLLLILAGLTALRLSRPRSTR